MKRILPLLLAMLLLCGCTTATVAETTVATTVATQPVQTEPVTVAADMDLVGICLPDKKVQRWVSEAAEMERALADLGYGVEICYAGSSASEQARQVQALVEKGVACLIIAAVDSVELVEVEELALSAGIPVIAYDRLLMDTQAVCAYVGFDYLQLGRDMGAYIRDAKMLDKAAQNKTSYTVEFFMGSPEDHNALMLYQGLMEYLQPYLEDGTLVCVTGRTAFEDCCVADWSADGARGKFARYLAEDYPENAPDILCTAGEDLAAGCLRALAELEESRPNVPLLIGVGNNLLAGQSAAFPIDTGVLAEPAARIADQLITGQDLEVTDTEGCHNHAVTVPAWFAKAEQIIE